MSLRIKWALIVLAVAYGIKTFAAVENFNQMIDQTIATQNKVATEIQTQLKIKNQKDTETTAQLNSVSAKDLALKLKKIN